MSVPTLLRNLYSTDNMAKVSLTLGESKTKVGLTLEGRGSSKTWNTVGGTWNDHPLSTWNLQREIATLETKIKDNLALETK